jgi:putative ABC transport system permease protein
MLYHALFRRKRKLCLIAVTMALGVSLSTAMLNVMMDVESKLNRELKVYGANLNVVPRETLLLENLYGIGEGKGIEDRYIAESELPRLKTIFWAFNIVDFAPYLPMVASVSGYSQPVRVVGTWFGKRLDLPTGYTVHTGISGLKSWWSLMGGWPSDDAAPTGQTEAMVGQRLAEKLKIDVGGRIEVVTDNRRREWLIVKGVFHSGGAEDEEIYVPLRWVQEVSGRQGLVQRVDVSALTTPENDLARRAATNPESLTRKEWDAWYCTAYISSIAYQIEEVLTQVRAKPVLQVSESEGGLLLKVKLLMLLLTAMSLVSSALGISSQVSMNVMERNKEIGLMKAVGATDADVILLVLLEVVLTALAGAAVGYGVGLGFAQWVGYVVFGLGIAVQPVVIPIVLLLSVIVALAGSLPALRALLSLQPVEVLYER